MLLNSALMISANDSAYALGYDLGGGSMRRFYGLMNDAAADLGMRDTHYASPNGLDDDHNRRPRTTRRSWRGTRSATRRSGRSSARS